MKGKVSTTGEDGLNKPIVTKVEVLLPKGGYYAGGKLPKGVKGKVTPKCSEAAMMNGLPQDQCPKGSIVGSGTANAWADTVKTRVKITVVNGGANRVYLFTELTNPAVVQLPMPGKIQKQRGKWAYKVTFTVPGGPAGRRRRADLADRLQRQDEVEELALHHLVPEEQEVAVRGQDVPGLDGPGQVQGYDALQVVEW